MKFYQKIFIIIVNVLFLGTLHVTAQNEFEGVVRFDKTVNDFGDFLVTDGEKTCTFTFTNISNKPIVVHRVISSCGCTEPTWDKAPIRPNEKGTIRVTFKNDQGPYPFDKAITTYISDLSKPIVLRIRGVVTEKKKTLEEQFSYKAGAFGMRKQVMGLGQISQGLTRSETIEVANVSSKEIKVDFTDMTPGLTLTLQDNPIPAKSKTVMTYSVNTSATSQKLWGMTDFTASVKVNGFLQREKVKVETLIKENFSGYTQEEIKSGALPQFNTSSLTFSTCKAGQAQTMIFTCKNIGKETLTIYKVDSSEPGCTFKYPESIPSGESGRLEVTIDTKGMEGEVLYILTLITNAPIRPMVNVFITGNVEK